MGFHQTDDIFLTYINVQYSDPNNKSHKVQIYRYLL